MTLIDGIIIWGSFYVTATLVLVAGAGLLWSPFAALISWHVARRRGLNERRHALAGAAYSVFLLLPWILLLVELLGRRVPWFAVLLSYVLLYFVWLSGPVWFWANYHAAFYGLELYFVIGGSYASQQNSLLVGYGVIALMLILWFGSGINLIRKWNPHGNVVTINYIIPFALAWICTLVIIGYVLLD